VDVLSSNTVHPNLGILITKFCVYVRLCNDYPTVQHCVRTISPLCFIIVLLLCAFGCVLIILIVL